jgi:hypothetical protein
MVLSTATTGVALGVMGTGVAQAQESTTLYQANAGGSFTADGATWQPLEDYLVAGGGETAEQGQPDSIDGSVPDGTPSQIWNTERWDPGDPGDGDEMQYEFDVQSGQQVEVRLYFYDGCTCTSAVGERVFDVSVEGQTVLDNFDIIDKYGDQTGAMESFTVVSDGTIDVDFAHVTENPQINAIEIVSAEPQADTLGGPGSTDFGSVVTGNSQTETVTVTNLGGSGDPNIDISGVSVTGTDAGDFSAGSASQTTLAPGESADVPVTFTPSSVDPKSATLEVAHTGSNSPLAVDLSGEGVSDVPVGFGSSELDLSGVSVDSINNPTSLQFGPDDRLYVSQQNGIIYAFDVQRNGANDYEATSVETITTVKNDVPNHNDDGEYNSNQVRQVTGITVTGTASQPILYVSSSDWRIATNNNSPPSESLDTNSGVVSKLTQTSSGWDHTMLVRGLPRSEENHAPNGLALDEQNGVLYLAEGGHTNMGTPSNFFSNIPEYAYSGAILSIDLDEIESMTEKDAANTDVPYLYDLPTLAPGQTSTDGPFGGLDGANMAILEQDSPVQIHASGFRNPYDVHLTEDGQLYSVDNGPNGGLGGPPTQACEVASQNGGTTYDDNLHYISGEGYYAGHPNPVRGNSDYLPGAVYDGYDGTGECDYLVPGQEDGALATFGASTNGLTEYTASNFGGAMQGDLLTSSFDGNVYRIQLDAQGDGLTESPTPLLSSGGTLDVTAQGDDGQFPGTVWSAERTDNAIQVFEPNDFGDDGGDQQCDPNELDPTGDADGDGYTNGDEQAVGTDPCSAGSVPADYDDDNNPNALDDDDDNDGLSDSEDPFALDPDNGLSTQLPVTLEFSSTDTFANTIPATSGGTDGLGFTGLMTNGQDPYSDLYDPDNVFAGGQANLLSVSEVPNGDAYQSNNDQQYAFQFGADTADVTEPFTVHTTVAGFPENPDSAQSVGMFVGNGDQDNYIKFVVSATDGTGGVQLAKETGGTFTNVAQPNNAGVTGSGQATDLYLTIDPSDDTVTASYSLDGGETMIPANVSASGSETGSATTTIPESWLSNENQGLAIGVISTSLNAPTFSATWDQLSVQYAEGSLVADAGDDQTVDEGTTVGLDASGSAGDGPSYSWTQTAGPSVTLSDASAAQPTFTAPDVDGETTLTFEVEVSDGSATDTDTVNVTVQDTDATTGEVVYTVNAGGSEYTAGDGTVYAADSTDELVGSSQTYSTSNWASSPPEIVNTDDDPLYRTERYGTDFGYEIPVPESGTYEVTLQFAEIYQGAAPGDTDTDADQTGQRVFDVTTEGQEVLDNYDPYAEAGDSLTAVDETYTVEVTDGTLNVGFDATDDDNADNAKISAIKVVSVDDGGSNTAPAVDPISDQTVTEGETLDVSVTASDDDSGDTPSLSLGSAPGFAGISDDGDGTGTVTLAPTVGAAADSPYTVEVVADDGTTTTTESFQVTVESAGIGGEGDVQYRINAGGQSVAATDGGPDWSADTDGSPSQYVNVDEDNGVQTYSTQDSIALDDSVPSGTPASLFQTERWDADTDGSTADDTEMQWSFPAQQGETYEVRLYFAEIAFESGASSLPRTFDVVAEGETKLDDYNIFQQYGHDTGAMETFTVTPTDGTIDLEFLHEQENPKVSAIEIVGPEPPAPDAETAADVTVTEGGGTDASTYGSGSFTVENTGTEQIESVTFDLSSTAFPDVVFDPEGTAGDESGKCFTADSGASETGLLTDDGACSAPPYSEPNSGQDGSDGYETLTIEFDDFDPGETFTFSADLDPTSIKGAVSTQNSLAGPIGGSDMIGGTVVVESADATVSNDLFTDGSAGGSQSTVSDDAAAAPTVSVDGVSLGTTTFGEHAAGAATVADAQQSVTVTGATPGETVTLLRIEGELNVDGVPDYDGTPGYDVEEYEANRVLEVETYTATADSNGEATFAVTLTDSSDAGGLNYLVAAVGDSAQSGQVSQSAVLELDPGSDDGPGVIDDFENAPADPDGDGLYEDVNGDGAVNSGDAQALFANTDDPVIQNNADAFDFNGDGAVNSGDAQALFANGEQAGDADGGSTEA